MKTIGLSLFLTLTGPGLLWIGVMSVRRQWWRESVPLAEFLIDRAAGIDPPPRTAWDRRFARFQAWMHIILGTFFMFCLIAIIVSFVSE